MLGYRAGADYEEYAEVLNEFKLYIFNNILSYLVCSVLCQHEVSASVA